MDIVWKDTHIDPTENLTKLSQFVQSYATTIIDKTRKVLILLKDKEQRILLLVQQLAQEKSNLQADYQVAQLQKEFNQMRIQYQAILAKKDLQIQAMIDKLKDNLKIDELIKEALTLNS